MAKPDQTAAPKVLVPSATSQKKLMEFCRRVQDENKKFNNYHAKMEAVDVAYARYKSTTVNQNGIIIDQSVDAATTPVGVMGMNPTTPPVVVSQVDAMVGYLADVFLSGSPLFPVVSNPSNVKEAEDLETLLDDHATLGGYARQLLMFLKDGVKYNFSAIEIAWTSIDQYTLVDEILTPGADRKLAKASQKFSKIRRLDPYNVIWDHNVNPGDISAEGDYAGYVELVSRTKLKRRLTRMGLAGESFNTKEAQQSTTIYGSPEGTNNYIQAPQISNYISSRKPIDGINWYNYLTGIVDNKNGTNLPTGNYEILTLYVRILPSDFDLIAPEPNTVQIWKLTVINGTVLVEARRIISAYDTLPILFGQPLEDGLGFQTQSIAEAAIPFQESSATMLNIRFNSARRAVSDRALFDPSLISASDINAPTPAAKIPVKINSLDNGKTIADAYHQIPFDPRGTETALQDGMMIAGFAKEMAGLNNTQRGQFQKGNKSVSEFETTMAGSDAILRMPAMVLEYQAFMPMKNILKLNIYQYGDDAVVVSQKDGSVREVNIAKLREKVLSFRLADGYTPKSKLASTDAIVQLMQMVSQNPMLQQQFGPMLPNIVVHLAQLMGIRGLEQYLPSAQPAAGAVPPPAGAQGAIPQTQPGAQMPAPEQAAPQQGVPA